MGATKTVQAHAAALELWGPGMWVTYIFMVQSFAAPWLMNTLPATTSFQFSALIFASVKICSCSRSLSVAFLSKSHTTFRAKRRRRTPLLCVSLQLPCWPKFHFQKKIRQLRKSFYLIWTSSVYRAASTLPFTIGQKYVPSLFITREIYYQRGLYDTQTSLTSSAHLSQVHILQNSWLILLSRTSFLFSAASPSPAVLIKIRTISNYLKTGIN